MFLWECPFLSHNYLWWHDVAVLKRGGFGFTSPYCPSATFLKSLGSDYLQTSGGNMIF